MKSPRLPKELRDAVKLQKQLKAKPESYWLKRGEDMALRLFHDMAEHVPAYKDFLSQHGINHKNITNIRTFEQVPTIDKDNYLRKYPLEELCWEGKLGNEHWVISSTSGSTGEPFYFPRTDLQDEYYALTAELYLRENFQIHQKSTLYIDAFAMGAWIGGVFTYEAVHRVAQKGYALSITTPGINKAEVINNVRKLGSKFDQVIIGCYPPIMRDIIDLGIEEGLDWAKYNLGIVFSAEGFSEEFRDYVAKHGKMGNIYTSSLNHYGTVDLGTMSHETAPAILIRRQAVQSKELFTSIFGDVPKQPTLTQYLPELFYFESVDNRVLCSSYGGLPLVRYDLKDHGGVVTLQEIANSYAANGKDLPAELAKAGLSEALWNLPFAYVYERSDMSVNLVGGVVYSEEIRKALLDEKLQRYVSGKFTMEVVNDRRMNSKLVIHVELRPGIASDKALAEQIQEAVVALLLRENTEYASNYTSYGRKLYPQIKLWAHEHPLYFSGKGKQKWVR